MNGRPKGQQHPLTWSEFWILFLEQLPEAGTVCGAYHRAEEIVIQRFKRRRFKSYQAFRNAKSRFYKCNSFTKKRA